jgi:uncharacterized protein (TIGR02996 family)
MSVEKGFLDALLKEPDSSEHRLIYADWLEEQGDLRRAEFLRLEVLLAQLTLGDPQRAPTRDRLRELLPEIGADWLALLDRTLILNCRGQEDCPGRWEKLSLTVKARIRECGTCHKFVQHARTEDEARELDAEGKCVAVDSRVETPILEIPLDPLALPDLDAIRERLLRLRSYGPKGKRRK